MDTTYCIDNFVTTTTGDAIRLLPFGPLVKGGVKREITPELAAKFKLPHFRPPIKLGSHDDETPAGGFIVGLEVRDDGLYGLTEWTEKGLKARYDGDYRYQSPEVIWDGLGFEHPDTGETIPGPLIVGTALLHTPHLGERAALFTAELEGLSMTDTVTVPASWLDKFLDRFTAKDNKVEPAQEQPKPAPQAEPTPQPHVEHFAALQQERDNLAAELGEAKAEVERLKAERQREQTRTQLVAELRDQQRFGGMFVELTAANEAADVLGGMTKEQRAWVEKHLSALANQVKASALFSERGSSGEGAPANPVQALHAAVSAVMTERKVDYAAALDLIAAEQPGLVEAAYPRGRG
jgi:hypothetical protein